MHAHEAQPPPACMAHHWDMKAGIPILASLGILGYVFFKRNMDAVDRLTYKVKGVSLRMKGLQPTITVKVGITNPTRQPLFFDRIEAAGTWQTSPIGTATYNQRTIIESDKETVVPIPFMPSGTGIIQGIIAAVKGGSLGTLQITGAIIAGPLRIPIDETIQAKVPA